MTTRVTGGFTTSTASADPDFHKRGQLITDKSQLRQQMLAKRASIPSADRLSASQSVTLHFSDHPYLAFAKSFAGYHPFRDELDILPIFNKMSRLKKQFALPHVADNSMEFKCWNPGETLETDNFGIKTPPAANESIQPELVLVPLLAFTPHGARLGYGGGYYDRTMEQYRKEGHDTLFVGVAYDAQELPELPVEEHDQPLDGILTESGVSMFARQ